VIDFVETGKLPLDKVGSKCSQFYPQVSGMLLLVQRTSHCPNGRMVWAAASNILKLVLSANHFLTWLHF
jgi:hypothetical protein